MDRFQKWYSPCHVKETRGYEGKAIDVGMRLQKAVQKYIQSSQLGAEDYFVGAADRWGNFKNRMITERSYNRLIHEWLGFAPYTLRKTQITHMHRKKADLATIAKQSGHKSLQTITQHYLEVDNADVEEYL